MATLDDLLAAERENTRSSRVTLDDLIARSDGQSAMQSPGSGSVDAEAASEFNQKFTDLISGAAQGMSFGFDDNISGAISAVRNFPNMREGYRAGVLDRRSVNQASQERSPLESGLGQVAGALVPAVATGPLATGRTALGTLARSTGLGAAEGALHATGASDGQNVAENAAWGAGIGGLFGLGAPVISATASPVVRAIGTGIRSVTGKPSQRVAGETIRRVLSRTPDDIPALQRRIETAAAEGQPEFMLADAMGNPGQRALAGVARAPSQGRTEIADLLMRRQASQGERTSRFIDDAFQYPGQQPGTTAEQLRDYLTAARTADANVNYPAARANAAPVDARGAVSAIDQRIAPFADTNVRMQPVDESLARYRQRLAGQNADGEAIDLSDFDQVLSVKQSLQDDIEAARRAGRNNEARQLQNIVNELDSALEASSDGYRAANDTFARQSREIDAIDRGQNAARPAVRPADAIDEFGGLNQADQDAFRAGYGDALQRNVERSAEGVNRVRPMTSDKMGAELPTFARNPDLLARRIDREGAMFDTRNQAIMGSRTADNLADAEDAVSDVTILGNLLAGRPAAAAGAAGQRAIMAGQGLDEATRTLVARALMSRNPVEELAPLLRSADISLGQRRIIEALIRRAATGATDAAGLGANDMPALVGSFAN